MTNELKSLTTEELFLLNFFVSLPHQRPFLNSQLLFRIDLPSFDLLQDDVCDALESLIENIRGKFIRGFLLFRCSSHLSLMSP